MNEIRTHGQSKRYHHTRLGINGRFDTMQAAVLLEKLVIFPEEVQLRQQVANRYQNLLPANVRKPMIRPDNTSVFAQYTIEVSERNQVQQALQDKGIPTAVHYPLGLHQQPIFKEMYASTDTFLNTELAASRVISLPMHPYLTVGEQQEICKALQEIFSGLVAA